MIRFENSITASKEWNDRLGDSHPASVSFTFEITFLATPLGFTVQAAASPNSTLPFLRVKEVIVPPVASVLQRGDILLRVNDFLLYGEETEQQESLLSSSQTPRAILFLRPADKLPSQAEMKLFRDSPHLVAARLRAVSQDNPQLSSVYTDVAASPGVRRALQGLAQQQLQQQLGDESASAKTDPYTSIGVRRDLRTRWQAVVGMPLLPGGSPGDRRRTGGRSVPWCIGKFGSEPEAQRAYRRAGAELHSTGKYCLRRTGPPIYPWDAPPPVLQQQQQQPPRQQPQSLMGTNLLPSLPMAGLARPPSSLSSVSALPPSQLMGGRGYTFPPRPVSILPPQTAPGSSFLSSHGTALPTSPTPLQPGFLANYYAVMAPPGSGGANRKPS
jgi:hypothetical protein